MKWCLIDMVYLDLGAEMVVEESMNSQVLHY